MMVFVSLLLRPNVVWQSWFYFVRQFVRIVFLFLFFIFLLVLVCWQQLNFKIVQQTPMRKFRLKHLKFDWAWYIQKKKNSERVFLLKHTFDCIIDVYVRQLVSKPTSHRRKSSLEFLIKYTLLRWSLLISIFHPATLYSFYSSAISIFFSASFFLSSLFYCYYYLCLFHFNNSSLCAVDAKRDSALYERNLCVP